MNLKEITKDKPLVLSATQVQCKIHPIVIFSILDHFVRRNDEQQRVIGTLLGERREGIIEIKNCFPVPHTEDDQVAVDMEFHRNMFDLYSKSASKEQIVGWYSTGTDITETSVMIHDFFSKEMNKAPVHLLVETNLSAPNPLGLNVVINSANFTVGDKILGSQFSPVPYELSSFEAEKVAIQALSNIEKPNDPQKLVNEFENLKQSIGQLENILQTLQNYVNGVLNKEIKGDPKIGRFLLETISSLSKFNKPELTKMFQDSLQDLLLVVYLSNLTRAQLSLANKLINSTTGQA